jgi:hypothetical protein
VKYPCKALLRRKPYERMTVDLKREEDLKKFKSEGWEVEKYWHEKR